MGGLVIRGGRPLRGRVRIGGRKNSAVAVIPAALLASSPSTLEELPNISDIEWCVRIVEYLGAKVTRGTDGTIVIDPSNVLPSSVPGELAGRLRASYYLLGVLLAKFGDAAVPFPGGCDLGSRPVDQHLKGLRALGAEIDVEGGLIKAVSRGLKGARIYLDVVSVGATINLMLAASMADGVTVIENAAKEPHVVDIATYLNSMGARIVGAGTDTIRIHGVKRLNGSTHAIIPDEIEGATYMLAAVGTGGEVAVENVIPKHLEPITVKLLEMGALIEEWDDSILVRMKGRPKAIDVKTLPYPGFPTDAQQPLSAVLSVANGVSAITENVWEGRFRHLEELRRMGGKARIEGRTAYITGVDRLSGASLRASDLRAGASLVVAALIAEGESIIEGIEHVDRGYENIEQKLKVLGADVERL